LGLKGEVLPIVPNGGGFDLRRAAELKHPGKTSARRLILLKGYHGWAGRALVGLRAIELSADVLQGYRIAIYMASPEVRIAAELLSKKTGIPIELVPHCSHVEMMRLYGQARIYVGLSISDAISTSLLEALVMGAFPIQSCTSCADEWIVDGESGFIVPPEDPEPVSAAIRRVISDDHLVDQAAEINWKTAESRLDENILRPQVIAMYEKVVSESKAKRQRGSDTR
jgi:glycosyltransferase involved in cell wall biosynthesis